VSLTCARCSWNGCEALVLAGAQGSKYTLVRICLLHRLKHADWRKFEAQRVARQLTKALSALQRALRGSASSWCQESCVVRRSKRAHATSRVHIDASLKALKAFSWFPRCPTIIYSILDLWSHLHVVVVSKVVRRSSRRTPATTKTNNRSYTQLQGSIQRQVYWIDAAESC